MNSFDCLFMLLRKFIINIDILISWHENISIILNIACNFKLLPDLLANISSVLVD